MPKLLSDMMFFNRLPLSALPSDKDSFIGTAISKLVYCTPKRKYVYCVQSTGYRRTRVIKYSLPITHKIVMPDGK